MPGHKKAKKKIKLKKILVDITQSAFSVYNYFCESVLSLSLFLKCVYWSLTAC